MIEEKAKLSIKLRIATAAACRRRLLEEGVLVDIEEFQAELNLIDSCGEPRLEAQFEECER